MSLPCTSVAILMVARTKERRLPSISGRYQYETPVIYEGAWRPARSGRVLARERAGEDSGPPRVYLASVEQVCDNCRNTTDTMNVFFRESLGIPFDER